jgi:hypothetical protein
MVTDCRRRVFEKHWTEKKLDCAYSGDFWFTTVMARITRRKFDGRCTQPLVDGRINCQAETNIRMITVIFFTLVFLCATQDVAVDGFYRNLDLC